MKTWEVAAGVAATWRITRLVVEDEIARPMRESIDEWACADPDNPWRQKLRYLVTCPYCVSVWAGLAIAFGVVPRQVRDALALSASSLAITWIAEKVEDAISEVHQ